MTRHALTLVLASQSPRRRELLSALGVPFEVMPPDPSAEPDGESPRPEESTADFVVRLAVQKAADVARRLTHPAWVIGCDTVAEIDGVVLGKPKDREDARRILSLLNARRHSVWSGLAVIHSPSMQTWTGRAESCLDLHFPSPQDLDEYLHSGQWQGKSGAFGYQDDHPWLTLVSGTAENVVGLPLDVLSELLDKANREMDLQFNPPSG